MVEPCCGWVGAEKNTAKNSTSSLHCYEIRVGKWGIFNDWHAGMEERGDENREMRRAHEMERQDRTGRHYQLLYSSEIILHNSSQRKADTRTCCLWLQQTQWLSARFTCFAFLKLSATSLCGVRSIRRWKPFPWQLSNSILWERKRGQVESTFAGAVWV